MGIFRITQITSEECGSQIVMRVPYRSSALQWLGPFSSKKRLHIANEWQGLKKRRWIPVIVTVMGSVAVTTPEGCLHAGSRFIVLSSTSTWGQLNLYSDCDFLPAIRKPILSTFSPFSIFALSENVSCESLLTLMKFQITPFIILLICRVV